MHKSYRISWRGVEVETIFEDNGHSFSGGSGCACDECQVMRAKEGRCIKCGSDEMGHTTVQSCYDCTPDTFKHQVSKQERKIPSSNTIKGLRNAAIKRDGNRCVYCGDDFSVIDPTLDHVKPLYSGGTWSLSNLVAACRPCNHLKGIMSARAFKKLLRNDPNRLKSLKGAMRANRKREQASLTHKKPFSGKSRKLGKSIAWDSPSRLVLAKTHPDWEDK